MLFIYKMWYLPFGMEPLQLQWLLGSRGGAEPFVTGINGTKLLRSNLIIIEIVDRL